MANTLKFGNGQWATGNGTALAYNDENANFKPLPFDFTRASSGTVVNQSGLIETVGSGIPRIDFQGNTKGALLLEPSRTNLITQSEAFDNVYWTTIGASATSGFISPDGTNNAYKLVEDTSTGEHIIYKVSIGYTSGSTLSYSFFAKKGERNVIQTFNFIGGGYSNGANFDLSTGIVSNEISGSGKMLELNNGWYRCEFTSLATVGQSSTNVAFRILNDADENNYTGDGTSGVYIYGAQLEEGSYATSYIPTSGSAVTRVADTCNNGGNEQVINSTEGVLYLEGKVKTDAIFAANCIAISDGTDANRLSIIMYGNINSIRASMNVGGVSQFDFNLSSGYIQEQYYKIAVSYKANDCKIFINGVKILTDTSATMPSLETFDRLNLDLGQGLYDFYGNVKDAKIYNTALTDAQLKALTQV
jgi:hypothetical protein